jgi:hypothetical protein
MQCYTETWLAEAERVLPQLVAKIKCLEMENCAATKNMVGRDEDIANLMKEIAAKDALNDDLMANCNQLRNRCWKAEGELARWQKIAVEERAAKIQEANSGDFADARGNHMFQVLDLGTCREMAAKELNLRVTQETAYVERLEKEFLDIYPYAEIGWSMHGYPIEFSEEERQTAQAALIKIREGK